MFKYFISTRGSVIKYNPVG